MIIASGGLVTIISSKARKRTSSARSAATCEHGIALLALARRAQPLVHLEHEGVKVDPALGGRVDVVERQVHQHRLAAPDPAPQIDPAARRGLAAEQARQEAGAGAPDRGAEAVERGGRPGLVGIGLELARRDQRGIGVSDAARGHAPAVSERDLMRLSEPLNE